MNLPASFPIWMAVIGCFAAIVITKELFGGIGQNFANPALVGRIVLFVSFAKYMTDWNTSSGLVVASATPLGMLGTPSFPPTSSFSWASRAACWVRPAF